MNIYRIKISFGLIIRRVLTKKALSITICKKYVIAFRTIQKMHKSSGHECRLFATCFWHSLSLKPSSWWDKGILQDRHIVVEDRVWSLHLLISRMSIYPYNSRYESSMPASIIHKHSIIIINYSTRKLLFSDIHNKCNSPFFTYHTRSNVNEIIISMRLCTYIRLPVATRSHVSAIMPIKCDFFLWSRHIGEPQSCIKKHLVV